MQKEYKFGRQLYKLNLRSEADESVFREIFLDRDYMVLDDIIGESSDAILDIGAHIGLFSMYARGINDNVKIFAYEPAPDNFSVMKEHFKENHIDGVFVKNVAVTGKDGDAVLLLSEDSHNHSILRFFQNVTKEVKVQTSSMARIFDRDLSRQGINRCDLVKMDCEGAEFEILPSIGPEVFKKIGSFYIEYHEYLPENKRTDLVKILQSNGFKTRVVESRYDKKFGFILAYR